MPENETTDEPIPIGDVMVHAFRVSCENAALRRLVMSMALSIDIDLMPADERDLLHAILNGE